MKITAIHDLVVPIRSSDIRNAFIDFSQMTASIVGIQSDVIRDGASPSSATASTPTAAIRRAASCATASSRACSKRRRTRCSMRPATIFDPARAWAVHDGE